MNETFLNFSSNSNRTPQLTFSWIDYTLFALMLGMSMCIGVYYGFFGKKQNTPKEYLLGGKTMNVFPVSMSIVASTLSGITILSVPADVYVYGGHYLWAATVFFLTNITIGYYVFQSVFLNLQLQSIYDYLDLRFNYRVRRLASFFYIVYVYLYNPVIIYVPALVLAQATGINLHIVSSIISIVCICYTTIGGLKGVIWTDTVQAVVIFCSLTVVFGIGISAGGGLSTIWQKSIEGLRLDLFDFQIDPTMRNTFWSPFVGTITMVLSTYTIAQGNVQRLMSVPSKVHAKKVIFISVVGIVIIKFATAFMGLMIFARYSDCDPLKTKQVSKRDQLLPYYVMDVAGHIPGLPGLFIAGIVSAGLSSMSTLLNALSGVVYQNLIFPFMPADTTQKKSSNILKLIVAFSGIINMLLVFVVEQLGGLLPLVLSVNAISAGPTLGLFTMGLLIPCANSKGALVGGIAGAIVSAWMSFGYQYYTRAGSLQDFSQPTSVEGCDFFVNSTIKETPIIVSKPFLLYRITFWHHTTVGVIATVFVGLIVSWITRRKDDPPVDRNLLSPVIHFLLPKERIRTLSVNGNADKASELVPFNTNSN